MDFRVQHAARPGSRSQGDIGDKGGQHACYPLSSSARTMGRLFLSWENADYAPRRVRCWTGS